MNTEQGNAIATEHEYSFKCHSANHTLDPRYTKLCTSIIQAVVTMVTANEKYSLLKSTYISDYTQNLIMNTEQGNAIATEYEYKDSAASIVTAHSYSRSVV